MAWTGSGGGFSHHFAQPAYQAAAVEAYLSSAKAMLPTDGGWNATGRGFPDVSALGGEQNQYCIYAGELGGHHATGAYGTSAATPVLATVVAKLNRLRSAAGKPPLGFVKQLVGGRELHGGLSCRVRGRREERRRSLPRNLLHTWLKKKEQGTCRGARTTRRN